MGQGTVPCLFLLRQICLSLLHRICLSLLRRICLFCCAGSVFSAASDSSSLLCRMCPPGSLSEIVVDQVQDRIQIGRIHLPGRGSLSDCAKGAGTAEDFAAQSADQAGTRHGHGNDRAVRIIGRHFFGRGEQNQDIFSGFRHDSDLNKTLSNRIALKGH